MTDQEIQCLILKVAYNDPKGVVDLSRINTDYGVPMESVLYNARCLKDKDLLEGKRWRGSISAADATLQLITEQGRHEYENRCANKINK